MSHFGAIGHHLIVAIIDHIPNGWVMFNGDMTNDPCPAEGVLGDLAFQMQNTKSGPSIWNFKTFRRRVGNEWIPRCEPWCWNMNPNINPHNHPNVGKYTIHGAYGIENDDE